MFNLPGTDTEGFLNVRMSSIELKKPNSIMKRRMKRMFYRLG